MKKAATYAMVLLLTAALLVFGLKFIKQAKGGRTKSVHKESASDQELQNKLNELTQQLQQTDQELDSIPPLPASGVSETADFDLPQNSNGDTDEPVNPVDERVADETDRLAQRLNSAAGEVLGQR